MERSSKRRSFHADGPTTEKALCCRIAKRTLPPLMIHWLSICLSKTVFIKTVLLTGCCVNFDFAAQQGTEIWRRKWMNVFL